MNSYKALTKTFIKSLAMSQGQDKRRKMIITFLSIFAIFGIMLPGAVLTTLFVKITAEALTEVGLQTLILKLIFYVICIFNVIFGINVVLSELYFSNDIEYVLPWPVPHHKLVASKFTSTYLGENLMQIIFVIAAVIGFGLGTKMSFTSWLLALLGVPFLALLPMIYCAIISMLVMRFTKLIKNKDIVQKLTVFVIFGLLMVLLSTTTLIKNFDLDVFINDISNLNHNNLTLLNIIFINVPLYINAIANKSILSFLGFVLVNVVAIIIMLVIADLTYYKGLVNLSANSISKRKKSLQELIKNSKMQSQFTAYLMKEIKILRRTPIFYTHCILSNFIWPIFAFAIYKVIGNKITINYLITNYSLNTSIPLFIMTFIIGISAFVASLNSISSNAISREGKHFQFMKSIPVNYNIQLFAKTLVGILFATLGVMVFFIPACIVLKIPFFHTIIYIMLGILAITFTSYLGIYIDSIQPKLVWDDELNVLRENYNMFFSMAIILLFIGLICFCGYFYLKNMNLSFTSLSIIFISILLIFNFIIHLIAKNRIIENIITQEEV